MKLKRLTFKDFINSRDNDSSLNQKLINQIIQKDFCGLVQLKLFESWIQFLLKHLKELSLSIYVAYFINNKNDNEPIVLSYLIAGPVSKNPNIKKINMFQSKLQFSSDKAFKNLSENDNLKNVNSKTKNVKKLLLKSQYMQIYIYCQNNSKLFKKNVITLASDKSFDNKKFFKTYRSAKNALFYYFIYHLAHSKKYKGIYLEIIDDPRLTFIKSLITNEHFFKSKVFQKFFHQNIIMKKNISFSHLEINLLKKYLKNKIDIINNKVILKNESILDLFQKMNSWYEYYKSLNFQYVRLLQSDTAYYSITSPTLPTFSMILNFKDIPSWYLFAKKLVEL